MKEVKLAYVIEDDETTSFLVKRIVDSFSEIRESKIFVNGEEAMNALLDNFKSNQTLPDLILLDINMPVMDGWDFLDALTKINTKFPVPVYLLTSSIDPCDMEKAKRYKDVQGFLSKPLTKDRFKEEVLGGGDVRIYG